MCLQTAPHADLLLDNMREVLFLHAGEKIQILSLMSSTLACCCLIAVDNARAVLFADAEKEKKIR
jgi:hypothetical protein